MLVPIEWLNDYIELDVDTEEFCDRMIMSGSNLETCKVFGEDIHKVVVGRIDKIEPHPDADKLVICRVDVGEAEPIQIVTGAPNIFEGALVPVALDGSHIPGPLHGQPKTEDGVDIKKGKLRGVESFGMLCSCGELGFDDKVVPVAHRDGIWILEEDLQPGSEFTQALGLKQAVVDFEITPNRPDCLAMVGMAREASATFGKSFDYPDTDIENENGEGDTAGHISVEIKQPEKCRRYVARAVTDVKVGPSPWWLQKRLMFAGMRPINNIVDITNFVMLEYGQPIHAFDIRQLKGGRIIVDNAVPGEKFTTLDETERELSGDMLMIRDAERPVAVAGVMGGLNSEIEEDTTTIIVESANFAAASVRRTAKDLGLRTEASARFEKGIDPGLCEAAADRVCRLIELTGSGKVCQGRVDVYPSPAETKSLDVRVDRINHVLGIDLSREEMVAMLEGLEIKVEGEGNIMKVTPPAVRQDLLIEEDYVEEIARMYGYDKLPSTMPRNSNEVTATESWKMRELVRDRLCAMGLNEIQTYSFVSPSSVDQIDIPEDSWERAFVRIMNPLGEENSVMRTVLTPNMLETLARNYSRGIAEVRAFEIGNTFMASELNADKLPDESYSLCIGCFGKEEDFFTLKGVICELLTILGIREPVFTAESEYGPYHPGRCARISAEASEKMKAAGIDSEELGIMGEIHPDVAEKYGLDGVRVYCCEIMFDAIMRKADMEKVYHPLPKYPAMKRDIALIVDEDMAVGDIEAIIRENGGDILEEVSLFDIYRGKQVEEGKKSAAFSLVYRDSEKTLTDEEVTAVHSKVLKALEDKLNAVLREM